MSVKFRIKLITVCILRVILRVFYLFPIKKNYILFSSFEGKQFSDNPKYLYSYIKNKFGDKYNYIWVLNNKSTDICKEKKVSFLSFRHIYYLMTCKYIVSNLGIEPFFPKRKQQIFVNTWHGSGAYKSQSLSDKIGKNAYLINMRDYRSAHTDYYISGCGKYSGIMADSWNADINKFLSIGTPRNDLFFFNENQLNTIKNVVYRNLNLSNEYGYILFAPTYRGKSFRNHKSNNIEFDSSRIISAAEKRFGKPFKFLYRCHIGSTDTFYDKNIINVSPYPDMQEIMLISDILITDYSSSMWDFSFLKRPGFLYVPDLNDYLNERDFYTPIETWPFEYAKNEGDLEQLILHYDDILAQKKIEQHLNLLESYEQGCASEKLVEKLGL